MKRKRKNYSANEKVAILMDKLISQTRLLLLGFENCVTFWIQ